VNTNLRFYPKHIMAREVDAFMQKARSASARSVVAAR
jgi:hypothetical protein